MLRWTMPCEQFSQHRQDVIAFDLPLNMDGQTLAAELIDDSQHAERLAVMGAISDKVVAPDMASMSRPKPDARSVVKPQAAALRLSMRYFQPFATPDPLNPLGIHRPTFLSKQGGDAAVSVAPVA